ncbi:hypothetical protein M878_00190 [Streptomyces roseochromogenus subsp. oscitans DS 12.976]|uniref:Uncharacterized protein n=1 Tax=Streptomyces roseochromogenus subsp. oscitans DS 12.976 TaxID=1352936 RepID=V6KXE3_STRRC|nr:hypothetical protein M878_00190 [Streptomyces roseochromogenus subsp. oscitans DS 12.976]
MRWALHAEGNRLTWRHDGKTIAVWDFNIELD